MVLQAHAVLTPEDRADAMKEAVMAFIAGLPEGHPGASKRMVRAEVPGRNEAKDAALAELVEEGYVISEPRGQSVLHRFAREYTPFEEVL